ncbi:MAG TPA: HAD hydrolase-like protein [Candidatus Saccharimonadales bacterium]|nr:HAD hydrolase-like protein [Candidatus Saccharimonadales bacterium]
MKTIIFDFDGTIADSFVLFVDILHKLMGRTERVSATELERLRGMSLLQAAREVHVPWWRLPLLASRGRRMMLGAIDEVHPCQGMPEALKTLHADGYQLFIMSSNSALNIDTFLKTHGLAGLIDKVYPGVSLFGKARTLRKVIRQNRFNRGDVMYVGDEVRDIQGAKRAGIKVVSVTWGYNNADILERHAPDGLVYAAAELPDVVHKLQPLGDSAD